jgi:Mg2+ and Co2+ transporter CorA
VLDATRALRNNLEVIHSLKEERNLFGSEAPRKALDRYEVIQDTISARLHHADEFLKIAQDDWRVTLNEHQNMILFRMALLSGALTPVALVSSLFGMNFPDGLPYSTVTMAAALLGSVITAGGLVAALLRKQPYPRGRNV